MLLWKDLTEHCKVKSINIFSPTTLIAIKEDLQKIVTSCNSTPNRSIGMASIDVTLENETAAVLHSKKQHDKSSGKKQDGLSVGQQVWIPRKKAMDEKVSHPIGMKKF